jgi:hypothetical protein
MTAGEAGKILPPEGTVSGMSADEPPEREDGLFI